MACRSGSGENLFAPIAGDIADVARHRVAGEPSSKFLNEADTHRFGNFEMGGTRHPIELVEVVGQDAKVGETLEKFGQDIAPVIHPAEQNALTEHGDARIDQSPQRCGNCAIDFGRVIDVDDHDDGQSGRVAPGKKIPGNSLGNDDRHAGVEAQAVDVIELREAIGELTKHFVVERERVAAAQDHFVDRGVLRQVVERLFEAVDFSRGRGGRMVAAEAKTAMDAASTSCYDEGSASVFGEQTGSGRGSGLTKRVPAEPLDDLQLCRDRQDLAEEGVV